MPNEIAFKAIDEFIEMGGGQEINFTPNAGDPLVDPRLGNSYYTPVCFRFTDVVKMASSLLTSH